MKKIASVCLILLALCLTLSACGSSESTPAAPAATGSQRGETQQPPATEGPVTTTEYVPETTAAPELEIPFYTYTDTQTDSKGYVLEQQMTFSPWISQYDTELLDQAWSKVSRGKAFPSLGELGITDNYVISDFGKNYIDYDEVLYSVGYLEVFNRTDGFHITKTDTYSPYVNLSGANRFNTLTILYSSGSRTYYSVALGVFGTQGGGWSPITIKMQSDHWGPAVFVLAQAIDKTPNNPRGNPACEDVVLHFGKENFTLPVLTPENLAELAGGELDPDAEPQAESTTSGGQEDGPYFDSVEIENYPDYQGMTRDTLIARYGRPESDDGSVMTYDGVSWNGWLGNMRFFFDNSSDSCKTNCASWTTDGDEGIFRELCDALASRGSPGETSYPKEGQIEKAYIIDGFEIIAGYEDSSAGSWTYLFARYRT
ncbi:MAG: hypothetical protein IKS05_09885 [Oscillospiraceae bacterium]|nr:hypothetical protein [Oscillospiraceae bacterium]